MEREKIFDNEPRSSLLPDVGWRNAIPVSESAKKNIPCKERERERERKERGGSWGARPVLIIMHSVECCNYRAASLMHLSGRAYEKWTIVSFIWKWNAAWVDGVWRKILMAHGNHYPFPPRNLSLVCVFIIAIFFTFFTDFFFLPFALSLRIVLYICCVDCVEEKNVLSFLSSKILLNENVANCTHENFQGEKKFNKPLAPDALHQCALHYLHYTVSELKLVNCAISRALCHKLL